MIRDSPTATRTAAGIYEQPALRALAGETIRPGGLALTDQALALCALPPGASVLDVGCGAGATVAHLITRHRLAACGLDLSAALLRSHSQDDGRLPLAQAPGERLPIGSGKLDAIIAECSLPAMADPDQVLDEVGRVLKAEGVLIVSDVYVRNSEGFPLPAHTCVSGALSQAQTAERLRAHGFQITLWQDHSAALKELAVQLILSHGSLPRFWQQAASASAAPEMARAMARAKLGYYLLLAKKGHT